VSAGARNVRGGLIILSAGLLMGIAMSLYAFVPMVEVPAALDRYDDLPRRLLRLAHISAIMLPLINIVLGGWIDRLPMPARRRNAASWALLVGAVGVPLALTAEALFPLARTVHLSGGPVAVFCAGVFAISFAAWRDFPAYSVRGLDAGP
jgi:hypothetical protein